jgi:putative endonuclease
MAGHNQLGKAGEDYACRYLAEQGYTIMERNWRHQHKEIDIIASKDGLVVFFEVKTRRTDYFGSPAEAVNILKEQLLIDAAEEYIIRNNVENEIRFDVLSLLEKAGGGFRVEHIQEAFIP